MSHNYTNIKTVREADNMKLLLILLTILLGLLIFYDPTGYRERIKKYNYHVCVEVYGLNENCNLPVSQVSTGTWQAGNERR